jgi:hypothetical protein
MPSVGGMRGISLETDEAMPKKQTTAGKEGPLLLDHLTSPLAGGVRALRGAAAQGSVAMVELLLGHGADPARIGVGRWVLHPELALLLAGRGASIDSSGSWIGGSSRETRVATTIRTTSAPARVRQTPRGSSPDSSTAIGQRPPPTGGSLTAPPGNSAPPPDIESKHSLPMCLDMQMAEPGIIRSHCPTGSHHTMPASTAPERCFGTSRRATIGPLTRSQRVHSRHLQSTI